MFMVGGGGGGTSRLVGDAMTKFGNIYLGIFSKSEDFKSNEAQPQLKCFLRPKEAFLRLFSKCQKSSKIVKKLS